MSDFASPLRLWVVTDGKTGDRVPALGVAERLRERFPMLRIEERIVAPRPPWLWLMPFGRWLPFPLIDPGEAPGRADGPLAGPLPDLAIASGRRAVPSLKAIRRASGGRVFTVALKDARLGTGAADFHWVPEHDRLRGPNVRTTPTSPHRWSAANRAAAAFPHLAAPDGRPFVAVLVGGTSKDFRFEPEDSRRLVAGLRALAGTGAFLAMTTSRRTPADLAAALAELAAETGGYLWNGEGDNPYGALLGRAEALVVTADSTNMVGEALATGAPVRVFRPSGGSRKIDRFLQSLEQAGHVRPFNGPIEGDRQEALDATDAVAADLVERYLAHRAAIAATDGKTRP